MREQQVMQYLMDEGFNPKLKGFSYLAAAIAKAARTDIPEPVGKLYEEIAQDFNTTKPRVERCIRTAIEAAWRSKDDFKPSNADFIAYAALMFRLQGDA